MQGKEQNEERKPLKNPRAYEVMSKKKKKQYRLQPKPCNIVSFHSSIIEADEKYAKKHNNRSHVLDL